MLQTTFRLRSTAATALTAIFIFAGSALADTGQVLKGRIDTSGAIPGTVLDRGDIRNQDPFQNDNPEAPSNFNVQQMVAPPPPPPPAKSPLRGNAAEDTNPFNEQMGVPTRDQPLMPQQPMQQQMPPRQQLPPDPDSTPEMQLAWDAWHHRVADAIYQQFTNLTNTAGVLLGGRPLVAQVSYTATRDGRILNARINEKSTNMPFNMIVLAAVNGMNGHMETLQFPQGSRRMNVEKTSIFTHNYGSQAGYKYTTGDMERIRMQQQQQMMHR